MIERFIIVTSFYHEMNFVFDRCYDTFEEAREVVESATVIDAPEELQVFRICGNDVEPYASFKYKDGNSNLDETEEWWVLFGKRKNGEWGQTYTNTPAIFNSSKTP